jgi:hypothetical protein
MNLRFKPSGITEYPDVRLAVSVLEELAGRQVHSRGRQQLTLSRS